MSSLLKLYSGVSAAALLVAISAPPVLAQSASGAETVFVTATRTATALTEMGGGATFFDNLVEVRPGPRS